ncbi:MAG: hypothetical protein CMH83_23335 [Nocardioides sp.]|nr:hypothetical protein [Nocardioides sp.]
MTPSPDGVAPPGAVVVADDAPLRRVAPVAAGLVLVMTVVVLVGWVAGIDVLTRFHPDLAAMQPSTALGFGLVALAVLVVSLGGTGRTATIGAVAALALTAVGDVASLVAVSRGTAFPLSLLVPPGDDVAGTMSVMTSVGQILLVTGGLLCVARLSGWADVATGLAGVIGLQGLVGHLYGSDDLYVVGLFGTMSLPTSLAITALAGGWLLARPDRGIAGLVLRATAGGAVLRRLLPVVAVLPVLVGLVGVAAVRDGSADPVFVLSAMAVVQAAFGALAVALVGRDLIDIGLDRDAAVRDRDEAERARAEALAVRDALATSLAERDRLADDLAGTHRELSALVDTVADDLLTPLRAVTTTTELASTMETRPEVKELLAHAQHGAARGVALLEDLLAYERVGTSDLAVTRVVLEDAVEDGLAAASLALHRRSRLRLTVDDVALAGDPRLMTTLFQELFSDVLRRSPAGVRPSVTVEAAVPVEGVGLVEIVVEDNSGRVPPEERAALFDVVTERSWADEGRVGTRLALATCRRIVERHGGSIVCVDADGDRRRLLISLPADVPA